MTRPHHEFLRVAAMTFLAISTVSSATAAESGPIVAVTGGQVQGATLEKGGAVFKGIPFAQPPVGELRWREPMPVKSWAGVRDATDFGAGCAQGPSPDVGVSKEDCLYLNVWTAEWPGRTQKPVMVWIPGGGNRAGASSESAYDGESLARRGVILVSLNYRLGAFGFFSHPQLTRESSHHASGNQGILDQIAALKWVRDNIASFGGDPSNVTIFGESAGSLDVSVLMTSPHSQGLFQRVIGESGAVILLGDPRTLAEAEKSGEAMAAHWKLSADASVQDMRAVSAADILAAEPFIGPPQPNLGITIDGYVFSKKPAEIFAAGQEHRVALLLGNNSRERIPGRPPPTDLKKAIDETYGPLSVRGWPLYAAATNDPVYGTPAEQWATDTSFRCSAVAQLMWHAAAGNAAYEFEFARVPAGREALGATHASELSYVFGLDRGIVLPGPPSRASPVAPASAVDAQVSEVMQRYWTNFAKSGNPNSDSLPAWPKFDPSSRAYTQFTDAGPIAKEGLRRPYCDLFIENVKRLMGG
jgi:para-nitrobenzyl esterase